MDIKELLARTLFQCLDDAQRSDPDYAQLSRAEDLVLEEITAIVGEKLVDRLLDAQMVRMDTDMAFSFLYGLRLGAELLCL